jgi:hypothetical protein
VALFGGEVEELVHALGVEDFVDAGRFVSYILDLI